MNYRTGPWILVAWILSGLPAVGVDRAEDLAGTNGRAATERAQREAQFLMNQGLPFAEKMLREYGEFLPFGAAMHLDGSARTVIPEDPREQPPPSDILELLERGFREGERRGEYKAVAIFVNVRVPRPPNGKPIAAVQVGLEHRNGYCADVFFPHVVRGDSIELGEPFALERDGTVFEVCR